MVNINQAYQGELQDAWEGIGGNFYQNGKDIYLSWQYGNHDRNTHVHIFRDFSTSIVSFNIKCNSNPGNERTTYNISDFDSIDNLVTFASDQLEKCHESYNNKYIINYNKLSLLNNSLKMKAYINSKKY